MVSSAQPSKSAGKSRKGGPAARMSQRESQRGLGRTAVRMKGGSVRRERIGFDRSTTFIAHLHGKALSDPRAGRQWARSRRIGKRKQVSSVRVVGVAVLTGKRVDPLGHWKK